MHYDLLLSFPYFNTNKRYNNDTIKSRNDLPFWKKCLFFVLSFKPALDRFPLWEARRASLYLNSWRKYIN